MVRADHEKRLEEIEKRKMPKRAHVIWQDLEDPSKWYNKPVIQAVRDGVQPLTEEELASLDGVIIEVIHTRDWRAYKPAKTVVV